MSALALIARVLLAAVFAVAAATKLADQPGTREAVVGFGAPPSFHAGGTPMAVLIDAEGRIASHVAAGADTVTELANGR